MPRDSRYPIDDPRVLACKKAISRAGGLSQVARAIGITPQAIYKWKIVPHLRCHELADLSGIAVTELRPDLFKSSTVSAGAPPPAAR